MFQWTKQISCVLHARRGQILLPAVLLAPLFILLVYLLFEMSKLSMTKVRQQFALDSSAYSQMSAASGYLNALAQVNGPLPYRVMQTFSQELPLKQGGDDLKINRPTVFDIFYKAGAFASIGPSYELGADNAVRNVAPEPESEDWKFSYYGKSRESWIKEDPKDLTGEIEGIYEKNNKDGGLSYVITDKAIADNYFFSPELGIASMKEYLKIYAYTGDIYKTQTYAYEDVSKKARMFRESYFLNTQNCRRSECGKESASVLDRYILETKPFEIDNIRFYITMDYSGREGHSGAKEIDLSMSKEIFDGSKLFQFAYLLPGSRSKLRQMARGLRLKQKYAVPANRFNINLTQKYKPYVQNSIIVSCPRGNNNCVWPNPLPKYSVKVGL